MTLVVTFPLKAEARRIATEIVGGLAEVLCLPEVAPDRRASVLRTATVILAADLKGLQPNELDLIGNARLMQFMTAGLDYVPLSSLPPTLPIASNAGAYAEPMAEHALAMALAAAKRLLIEHEAIKRGQFNQFTWNRMLAGGVCGIFGFGGIGAATARIMRAIGMRVHGINRSGRSAEPLDWIGTPDRLDDMLAVADVLVISAPLTRATIGLFGGRELARMKLNAILVNLARGEIVDETALFAHLKATPSFTACIDAWWAEPIRHGAFRMDHRFLDLPNVIASPHNSASVPETRERALRRALENCRRAMAGEPVLNLVGEADRLL